MAISVPQLSSSRPLPRPRFSAQIHLLDEASFEAQKARCAHFADEGLPAHKQVRLQAAPSFTDLAYDCIIIGLHNNQRGSLFHICPFEYYLPHEQDALHTTLSEDITALRQDKKSPCRAIIAGGRDFLLNPELKSMDEGYCSQSVYTRLMHFLQNNGFNNRNTTRLWGRKKRPYNGQTSLILDPTQKRLFIHANKFEPWVSRQEVRTLADAKDVFSVINIPRGDTLHQTLVEQARRKVTTGPYRLIRRHKNLEPPTTLTFQPKFGAQLKLVTPRVFNKLVKNTPDPDPSKPLRLAPNGAWGKGAIFCTLVGLMSPSRASVFHLDPYDHAPAHSTPEDDSALLEMLGTDYRELVRDGKTHLFLAGGRSQKSVNHEIGNLSPQALKEIAAHSHRLYRKLLEVFGRLGVPRQKITRLWGLHRGHVSGHTNMHCDPTSQTISLCVLAPVPGVIKPPGGLLPIQSPVQLRQAFSRLKLAKGITFKPPLAPLNRGKA